MRRPYSARGGRGQCEGRRRAWGRDAIPAARGGRGQNETTPNRHQQENDAERNAEQPQQDRHEITSEFVPLPNSRALPLVPAKRWALRSATASCARRPMRVEVAPGLPRPAPKGPDFSTHEGSSLERSLPAIAARAVTPGASRQTRTSDTRSRARLRGGARSPSSRTRTPARPRSPRSCCSTAARSSSPATVKAKGDRRRTRSDWMAIERARGISVVTSVMTFEYGGAVFNLLDTPGHEDFSDHTYRTLTAVDAGRHGHRRRQGHRGAHAQAVRDLPAARHPDRHLHQQDGPREPRAARAARRDREGAGARHRARRLADRARARLPRHLRPDEPALARRWTTTPTASGSPAPTTRGSPRARARATSPLARGGRPRRRGARPLRPGERSARAT